jgi:phosphomannomutase
MRSHEKALRLRPRRDPRGEQVLAGSPEMAGLLHDLLGVMKVAVISGGAWEQFESNSWPSCPATTTSRTSSCCPPAARSSTTTPVTGQGLLRGPHDRRAARIITSLQKAPRRVGHQGREDLGRGHRGPRQPDHPLGAGPAGAPEAKQSWDPDFAKRKKITAILAADAAGVRDQHGRHDLDRRHQAGHRQGLRHRQAARPAGISIKEMLFAGDAIFPGGNDYPAQEAGVDSIIVRDTRGRRPG